MANGDCPVGAANKADIANHGREISEMKARMTRIEDRQDEHTIALKHQGWQIGLIVGLIVAFGGPLVQKLMALVLPLP